MLQGLKSAGTLAGVESQQNGEEKRKFHGPPPLLNRLSHFASFPQASAGFGGGMNLAK
jgi:hypothetical protein